MQLSLIAATRNRAKLEQLAALTGGLAAIEPLPSDISPEVEETGNGVAEIAARKAVAVSRALPGPYVVATDGGLLIPAMGSRWDPTRTRRFAGEARSDIDRAQALLDLTAALEGSDRRIGWREALAIAKDGRIHVIWEAESPPGLLTRNLDAKAVERGGGFWVPAVWQCPEYGGRLLADLTPAEVAARRDHWSDLGERLRNWIRGTGVRGSA